MADTILLSCKPSLLSSWRQNCIIKSERTNLKTYGAIILGPKCCAIDIYFIMKTNIRKVSVATLKFTY